MIFLLDARDPGTVRDWLAGEHGQPLAARVRVMSYQELLGIRHLPAETCVLGDHESLSPAVRAIAQAAWTAMHSAGVRLLNDPRRVPGRQELLARLARAGHNRFRAYRLSELDAGVEPRFPVFVRRARAHDGALTDLLEDDTALRAALRRLAFPRSRHRRDDLLVVEYCRSTDAAGRHLRLAALRIGAHVVPRYYTVARHWMVKTERRLVDRELAAIEHHYVTTNPHRNWVSETFEIAEVEYGRLDYGLVDGEPQAWEINTNPSLGRRRRSAAHADPISPEQRALQRPSLLRSHAATREALLELDAASRPHERVAVRIPAGLRWRYRVEQVVRIADKARRAAGAATLGAVLRRLDDVAARRSRP